MKGIGAILQQLLHIKVSRAPLQPRCDRGLQQPIVCRSLVDEEGSVVPGSMRSVGCRKMQVEQFLMTEGEVYALRADLLKVYGLIDAGIVYHTHIG